jgi:caspase domain-containing protein/sporulation related protein
MNIVEGDIAAPQRERTKRSIRRTGLAVFIVTLWALLAASPAAAEKRLALVVGNSAYQSIPKLDSPQNDAKLIADTLRGIGFTLVGGEAQIDLDKAGFDAALRIFGNELAEADVALFYYAGHGVRIRDSNYLVPVGANPSNEADADFQLVDIAPVLRQMEGAGTRLNLVILDACRSNPLALGLRSTGGGLAPMRAPERTLIAYAAQPGNVAREGSKRHSPYTKALAQTIRRAGLDLFQTFNEAGLTVKRTTGGQQQPWLSSSPIDGSFYFVEAPASARATSSTTDEAAQAWSAARDTTSPAVLEAFVRTYGSSFYASLARARLDDLKAEATKTSPQLSSAGPSARPAISSSSQAVGSQSAERVVLYDEDPSNPKGLQYAGTVIWHTETIKAAGKPDEVAIHADVDIPARKLKMAMSFARNTDPSLPASHTADLTFQLPQDFVGGDVSNLPGILMKTDETARGTPLAGLAVKVTTGTFLVGLSNVAADRARNSQLLLERAWFDIPLVYANQRRAILAVEKGASGDAAFQAAFAAWGQTPGTAMPQQTPDQPSGRDGGYVVQVSSQRSEEDALAAYKTLQSRFPDVLGSHAPIIKRADLGDKGAFYRAVVGPFATSDEAAQFCGILRTAGGYCIVQKN